MWVCLCAPVCLPSPAWPQHLLHSHVSLEWATLLKSLLPLCHQDPNWETQKEAGQRGARTQSRQLTPDLENRPRAPDHFQPLGLPAAGGCSLTASPRPHGQSNRPALRQTAVLAINPYHHPTSLSLGTSEYLTLTFLLSLHHPPSKERDPQQEKQQRSRDDWEEHTEIQKSAVATAAVPGKAGDMCALACASLF